MTGNALGYLCDNCGAQIDLRQIVTLCPRCGGLLEVQYDAGRLAESARALRQDARASIWHYRDFFPPVSDENIVTLGEGGTPLIKSKFLGPSMGIEQLYFKNDTLMPTGSFKDRGFSLAVSCAMDLGVKRGFTYSSGNAGASFSAYSARANFPGVVLVEYLASDVKKAMIMLYGTHAAVLRYDGFAQIEAMLNAAVTELGCYTFVNFINPIRHEAMKTYAYETYAALGRAPEFSFHPVGTGGGLWGAWKGYRELSAAGLTGLPRMMAVQPKEVCWLKRAMDSGAESCETYGDGSGTIAQSIAGNSPLQGGKRLLAALRDSGGGAFAVDKEEIIAAMLDLGREGISAEPSSAAAVAAFKQAAQAGIISSRDTVVCTITGTALKQPSVVQQAVSAPKRAIQADVSEMRVLLTELGFLP